MRRTVLPASAVFYTWTDPQESDGEDQFETLYVPPADTGLSSTRIFGTANLLADPEIFLVAPAALLKTIPSSIPFSTVVDADPTRDDVQARGMTPDGAATAIVVVRSKAPVAAKIAISKTFELAPYSSSYPSMAPSRGVSELTLKLSDFVKRGDVYFAGALLQSPSIQKFEFPLFAPRLRVRQAGDSDGRAVSLRQVPVLLLHGLWGDRTSLVPTRNALTDRYMYTTDIVRLGVYPADIPFDDPRTVAAVTKDVDALIRQLASDRIVGGRVDIVAHSMGGLATRAFASAPRYRGPADRMRGKLRQVVTLNTPNTGSEFGALSVR